MSKYKYGQIEQQHTKDIIVAVVDCLGGGFNAQRLLWGTCGAETQFGTYQDKTRKAGNGIGQHDEDPFNSLKNRLVTEKSNTWLKSVKDTFDIDVELDITWESLRHNVLYSMIMTRLKYKFIPQSIPDDIDGIAKYWDKNYNKNGQDDTEHFIDTYNSNPW